MTFPDVDLTDGHTAMPFSNLLSFVLNELCEHCDGRRDLTLAVWEVVDRVWWNEFEVRCARHAAKRVHGFLAQ